MTCPRCGAPNPAGNLYCQACGNQLTVVSGPPPGLAPPLQGPSGYQSPYYTPTAPTVAMHRTPWTLIVGGILVLTLLMAGGGTVLALLGSHRPAAASTTGITSALPSPSPATSPSPVASPTSPVTSASNDGVTVPVPPGWAVASQDSETIVLTDPDSTGSVTVASGPSSPAQTAQDNKNQIDDYFKTNYPDTANCPNTGTSSGNFNGAHGISWTLCFTLTAGGRSVAAAASLFAGANSSGSVYYVVMVVTEESNLQAYLATAKPVLQGVRWKL